MKYTVYLVTFLSLLSVCIPNFCPSHNKKNDRKKLPPFSLLLRNSFKPYSKVLFNTKKKAILSKIRHDVLDKIPTAGRIAVDHFIISDKRVVKSLTDAQERGVTVSVNTTRRTKQEFINEMRGVGVEVHVRASGLHDKRIIAAEKDPGNRRITRETAGQVYVMGGSANATMLGLFHDETDVMTKGDPQLYGQMMASHTENSRRVALSDITNKQTLPVTPEKTTAFDSQRYKLTAVVAQRILSLKHSSNPTDSFVLGSYTFNSEPIVAAIEEVMKARSQNKPTITVIADRSGLTNKALIKRLKKAGAKVEHPEKDSKIFGKFPILHHGKYWIRQLNGQKVSSVGSANMTSQSDKEMNTAVIYVNENQLFDDMNSKVQTDARRSF